ARRTCEASEPGQPFFARGQIFVLLTVGARHYETVEPAPLELGTQFGDAHSTLRTFDRIVEGLKAGLEHGQTLTPHAGVAMQACAQRCTLRMQALPELGEKICCAGG